MLFWDRSRDHLLPERAVKMTESDSSVFISVRELHSEEDNSREGSFSESGKAEKRSLRGLTVSQFFESV